MEKHQKAVLEMKSIWISHTWLVILLGCAICIVTTYLATNQVPELWVGAGILFSMFYELAIGYVISFIFFILQVYLPEKDKKRRAIAILKSELIGLAKACYEIIEVTKTQLKGENKREGIRSGDVYFKQTLPNTNDEKGWARHMKFTSRGFSQYITNIKGQIDGIINNSLYYYCGIEINELIASIQTDGFLGNLFAQLEVEEKSIRDVSTEQLFDNLIAFERIISRFLKLLGETPGKIILLNEQEKVFYLKTCKGKNLENLLTSYYVFL